MSSSDSFSLTAPTTTPRRRRTACDRCHSQKLRCLRTLCQDSQDCDRCLRLSAKCVYSPSCRIGRPPTGQKRSRPQTPSTRNAVPESPPSPSKFPQPVTSSMHQELPQMATTENFNMDNVDDLNFLELLNAATPFDPINNVGHGDFPEFSGASIRNTETASDGFLSIGRSEDYVGELALLSQALHSQLETVERGRLDTTMNQQAMIPRLQGYPVRSMFDNTQKLIHIVDGLLADRPSLLGTARHDQVLSGLNDYCVQAADNMSPSSSVDSPLLPDFFPTPNDSPSRPSTLTTTITTPDSTGTWPELTGCMDPITPATKPHTSVILLLLSCHVSLVRLYTIFYSHLRQYLLLPPAPTHTTQGRLFPDLELGSFQALMGLDLETTLVVQVSTHLLERLQRAQADCAAAGLITPALIDAVQIQEETDALSGWRNECGDVAVLIKDVKRLLRQRTA